MVQIKMDPLIEFFKLDKFFLQFKTIVTKTPFFVKEYVEISLAKSDFLVNKILGTNKA